MFDRTNNPTFAIYTGDEPMWGRSARDPFDVPPASRTKLVFPQHAELARHLLRGLIERGFDVANLGRFEPRGNPVRGVSHMVSNLVPEVDPGLEIPLVRVFMNEYFPPLPSAARCARLGEAIADVCRARSERIAIYASGGLSHYPGMYNAGWIDQPLDRWILEQLSRNEIEALEHLFTFDSDNLRSGTGEVRAWISVAVAMKRPATVINYVPAHCTQTGCGFVSWPRRRARRPDDEGSRRLHPRRQAPRSDGCVLPAGSGEPGSRRGNHHARDGDGRAVSPRARASQAPAERRVPQRELRPHHPRHSRRHAAHAVALRGRST